MKSHTSTSCWSPIMLTQLIRLSEWSQCDREASWTMRTFCNELETTHVNHKLNLCRGSQQQDEDVPPSHNMPHTYKQQLHSRLRQGHSKSQGLRFPGTLKGFFDREAMTFKKKKKRKRKEQSNVIYIKKKIQYTHTHTHTLIYIYIYIYMEIKNRKVK